MKIKPAIALLLLFAALLAGPVFAEPVPEPEETRWPYRIVVVPDTQRYTIDRIYASDPRKVPLYVTAEGIGLDEAADAVASMHGPRRIPALLKRADALCRGR